MKRRILAAQYKDEVITYGENVVTPQDMLGVIDNGAYHNGYDMYVDDEFNVTLTCTDDPEHMPKIEIATIKKDEDTYWFVPTLTFPKLTMEEGDYTDGIHYYLSKWEKVGRFITSINNFVLHPSEWVDEE